MSQPSRQRLSSRALQEVAINISVSISWEKSRGRRVCGTGFVVSSDHRRSFVLTNSHVVSDLRDQDREISHVATGQRADFRVVQCNQAGSADLALLETGLQSIEAASISDRRQLEPGEAVAMFGFPSNSPRYETGTFVRRKIDEEYGYAPSGKYFELFDLFGGEGGSGSAILDAYGETVAVLFRGDRPGSSYNTYGCPAGYIRQILRENDVGFQSGGIGRTPQAQRSISPNQVSPASRSTNPRHTQTSRPPRLGEDSDGYDVGSYDGLRRPDHVVRPRSPAHDVWDYPEFDPPRWLADDIVRRRPEAVIERHPSFDVLERYPTHNIVTPRVDIPRGRSPSDEHARTPRIAIVERGSGSVRQRGPNFWVREW